MKAYTKTFHEVHTSEDSEKWYKNGPSFDDTFEGLQKATEHSRSLKHVRHSRVVHVTKKIKILTSRENPTILSKNDMEMLLTQGRLACSHLPGVMVNEGFLIGFGNNGISHGPTRVTVSFHAPTVIGKCPPPLKGDLVRKAERDEWNRKAVELTKSTLYQCSENLRAANVAHTVSEFEIVLRRS